MNLIAVDSGADHVLCGGAKIGVVHADAQIAPSCLHGLRNRKHALRAQQSLLRFVVDDLLVRQHRDWNKLKRKPVV